MSQLKYLNISCESTAIEHFLPFLVSLRRSPIDTTAIEGFESELGYIVSVRLALHPCRGGVPVAGPDRLLRRRRPDARDSLEINEESWVLFVSV